MLLRRISRSENWKAIYVALPALFGAFCIGGMVGVWINVNPYYPALVAMLLWALGAVLMVALEERREAREPWQVLAAARSVSELRCECTNPDRDVYHGRDDRLHCGQCDGRLPDNYCTACGRPCAGESEA